MQVRIDDFEAELRTLEQKVQELSCVRVCEPSWVKASVRARVLWRLYRRG
jgi:hypothetical protein